MKIYMIAKLRILSVLSHVWWLEKLKEENRKKIVYVY